MEIIIYALLIIGSLVGLYYWLKFEPLYGEQYQLRFFGTPLFVIRLSGNGPWYTRLGVYLIFGPFKITKFTYEWVDEMSYKEYSDKQETYKSMSDHSIKLKWQPELKDTELTEKDGDFIPKNSSTTVLVSRKEDKISLKDIESFKVAAPFETGDSYRGYRIFTLFLNVDEFTEVISKARVWQEVAALKFESEYTAWSKGKDGKRTYQELQSTTMNELMNQMGSNSGDSFINEINETLKAKGFKFTISSVEGGKIFLNPETRDMLEEQEKPVKASFQQKTAEIEAKTLEITEEGKAKAAKIKAEAEATNIETIGTAKNKVLEERILKLKDLYGYQKDLITAKYGKDGLKDLKFYIEGNGQGADANTQIMVDTLLGLNIHEEMRQEGGAS
jgi:hypothetical protein